MCGIFAILNSETRFTKKFLEAQFAKGKPRGPENSIYTNVNVQAAFGFHRLAINGLNDKSNQPIRYNDISLICNGEIYNYRELYKHIGVKPTTDSDCEIIIHLYLKYGIKYTLQLLDGVFAFVLMDARLNIPKHKMYVARDPYGVRPLFWLRQQDGVHAFASELKSLSEIYNKIKTDLLNNDNISELTEEAAHDDSEMPMLTPFKPGHIMEFDLPWTVSAKWNILQNSRYHSIGCPSVLGSHFAEEEDEITTKIQKYFSSAVFKRCCTTERPIACLLSGGLDSSLVAALVSDYHRITGLPQIETYSIGLAGSEDLACARIVADYIGSKHVEIVLTEQDFIDAVPHVIRAIESYDTTTVRASIGNWILGKYISEHSDAKVIFNGDGSDELCGGYLYMHKCPDSIEFDRESRRLLKDIHYFDVLRSDRSISSHGLEPRTPFLDRSWVQYYLSIHPELRFHPTHGKKEKYLLRLAFSAGSRDKDILPLEILWRRKEAFSDGVSGGTRSLYQILQEHAASLALGGSFENADYNSPKTAEQRWYREIFEAEYPGLSHVIPYFWMPKYVEARDASARTLSIY